MSFVHLQILVTQYLNLVLCTFFQLTLFQHDYCNTLQIKWVSHQKFACLYLDWSYKPLQRVDPDVLQEYLIMCPDPALASYVMNGFWHGFDLGLTRFPKLRPPCKNLHEVRWNPEITQQLVDKEVQKDHIAGYFKVPPLPNMVYSPLNLVPKAGNKGKFWLIHNLSYPCNDQSVNSCIPQESSSRHHRYIWHYRSESH